MTDQLTKDLDALQFGSDLAKGYRETINARADNDALDWLDNAGREQGIEPPPDPPPQTHDGVLDTLLQVPKTIASGGKIIGGDLEKLPSEAGNILVGGPMKATENIVRLFDHLTDPIEDFLGVQIDDDSAPEFSLPNIGGFKDAPESLTGKMLQGITQFLLGFKGADKAFKAAKVSNTGSTGANLSKAAISDFAAFDPQEGNLANFIDQLDPDSQNAIFEFLKTDEQSGDIEGRLKNTLANFLPSTVIEPAIHGLRAMREARRIKELTGSETYEDAATKLAEGGTSPGEGFAPPVGSTFDDVLGRPDAPEIEEVLRPADDIKARLDKSFDEVDSGVPDPVVARSVYEIARQGEWVKPAVDPIDLQEGAFRGNPEGHHAPPQVLDDIQLSDRDVDMAITAALAKTNLIEEAAERGAAKSEPRFFGKVKVDDDTFRKMQDMAAGTYNTLRAKIGQGKADALIRDIHRHMDDGTPNPRNYDEVREYLAGRYGSKTAEASNRYSEIKWFHGSRAKNMSIQDLDVSGRFNHGLNSNNGFKGVSLTRNKSEAKEFADGGTILQVVPKIKKTFIWDMSEISKWPLDQRASKSETLKEIRKYVPDYDDVGDFPVKRRFEIAKALESSGFDSLELRYKGQTDELVVFNPKNLVESTKKTNTPAQPPMARDININFARIDSTDDVKRLIGQMADANAGAIDEVRRGVRTNKQTMSAAGDENAWRILVGERKGKLPLAEEQLALRQMWTASGEKLVEAAKLAQSGDAESMFAFRRMMAIHNMVQKEVIGVRTETARALQQWRIPAGGDAEKLAQIEGIMNATGGLDVSQQLAQSIADLAGRPAGTAAIDRFVQKSMSARTVDAVREFWINSILSGPKTQLVNILGNESARWLAIAERAVAGRIGHVLSPVDGVKIGEATAMAFGARQAYREAFRYAAHTMRTGEQGLRGTKLDMPRTRSISAEAFGQNADSMVGKGLDMLGSVVTIPGRVLSGADEWFKTVNYRSEVWAVAFRNAHKEVEQGLLKREDIADRIAEFVKDPPENVRLQAEDFAQYNTFTNQGGEFAQQVIRTRNAIDNVVGLPLGSMTVPFVTTLGNIFKYTFARSPLAPLQRQFRADVAAGGARRDVALAQMGLGTAALTVAIDLAMSGHLTGSGPMSSKDGKQRAALRRLGWQKYSLRVPTEFDDNGKPTQWRYFAFNRADPIGGFLGLAAEIAEAQRHTDGSTLEGVGELMAGTALVGAQIYMNKSMLSGFSDLVDAINDPERYGESYFTRIASSFVPTAVAEVARTVDPTMRHMNDLSNSVRRRIPGLSDDVPPRLDFWGTEISYQSGIGSSYDAVSPIYSSSTEKAEAIDKEWFELNYFPGHPRNLSVGGQNIPLKNEPEAFNRWVKLTSATPANELVDDNFDNLNEGARHALRDLETVGKRTLKQALNDLVTGKDEILFDRLRKRDSEAMTYSESTVDDKVDMISSLISSFRRASKFQVLDEHPELEVRRQALPTREDKAPGLPF